MEVTREERARRRLNILLTLPGARNAAEQAWIEQLQAQLGATQP